MNKTEARDIMINAFTALNLEQKKRLKWHHKQGTKILCGKEGSGTYYVIDGVG